MWKLDYKESWALKNWCFWTAVLEKTLESLLDCKEIQPVHPKGDKSWVFIGRTDVEAETPILWPPDVKTWLIGEDPDAGKDWRWEEKGTTKDEMIGWYHQWTLVWVNSGSWWWTGRPGVRQSMASWRVRHDWATELNWAPTLQADSYHQGSPRARCWLIWFLVGTLFLAHRWTDAFMLGPHMAERVNSGISFSFYQHTSPLN